MKRLENLDEKTTNIAIMQPYFAPYLGYVSLIKHTDRFLLFDTPQFIRHGWIERNRVLKQKEGWLYLQVPLLKFSRDTAIKDVEIKNTENWKAKILAQLQPYKKIAPNYFSVLRLLNSVFELEYKSIVQLNKVLLEHICKYLNINKSIEVFSELNLEVEEATAPDEWALNICKKINGKIHYINPIGGLEFFDRKKYIDNDIEISFQKMKLSPYKQKREPFEAGLSIIDVMMFNSIEEINIMLDDFELV